MLEKNSFSTGLLASILFPIIGFAVIYGLFQGLDALGIMNSAGFRPMFRERTSAIIGIACNAILLNYYSNRRYQNSIRGVVIATMVYVIAWMIIFGKYVLNN